MSLSAAVTIAFAVTSDPAATTPAAWNALCRTARRLAAEGYEIRIGAGPGGEQIVAEHALSAGGHVTLVLPRAGYEEAWVGQIRRWFPGRVAVEQEAPEMDGGCSSLVDGSAFLVVLGVNQYPDRSSRLSGPNAATAAPASDRSVTLAIECAAGQGLTVYDLSSELAPSWVDDALEAAGSDSRIEGGLMFRCEELDSTADQTSPQRAAGHGIRDRRAAPSLLRRVTGSRRPSSPGHRFAG